MRRVLIVDDERVIADTLVTILDHAGFESRAAYSGAAGVNEARSLLPDVAIIDMIMPDSDGIDVAIEIRRMLPVCKIFFFSARPATPELLQRAKASDLEFELLAKPIHPHDLLAKLG